MKLTLAPTVRALGPFAFLPVVRIFRDDEEQSEIAGASFVTVSEALTRARNAAGEAARYAADNGVRTLILMPH